MPETDSSVERDPLEECFHKHLDECERCRTQPFNLCEVGACLIKLQAEFTNLGNVRRAARKEGINA